MSTGGSLHQGGVEDANHMAGLLEQIKKCVSVLNFNSFKDGFSFQISSNIMFNCSNLCVETPQKQYLRECNKTPVKLSQIEERFKPSYSVKNVLRQVARVHDFQFHEPIEFHNLEDLVMTRVSAEVVYDYLEDTDISDIVKKFEEVAIDQKFYDDDICEYISEEFNSVPELSFAIIAVFSYMKFFDISVNLALEELFSLSIFQSVCEKCVTGPSNHEDKLKAVEFYNFSKVRSVMFTTAESGDDDSIKDANFVINCEDYSSSVESKSDSEEVKNCTVVFNPFLCKSPSKSNVYEFDDTPKVFNPYMASDDSNHGSEHFKPEMNSTLNLGKDSDSHKRSSSVKDKKSSVRCNFCSREFSNRYNMKLHLIRYDS